MPLSLIPSSMQYLGAAIFGLIFGSFLNVCVVRLPSGESIVRPGSHCPQCQKRISWYYNIPLFSYVLLRGRCHFCRKRIPLFYPAVEALTAGLFVAALAESRSPAEFAKIVVFGMLMIVLIFTDFQERIIPHSVTLLGIALGLVFSFLLPVNNSVVGWVLGRMGLTLGRSLSSLIGALAGGLFGGGILYSVAWVLRRLSGSQKEYLGFGDVMLMFVVGVFWGIPLTYFTILAGSLGGSLVALPMTLINRRYREYQWPYGSFLGAAAVFVAIWGQPLLASYLNWQHLP